MTATGLAGFPATSSMHACARPRAYGDFLENLSNLSRPLFLDTNPQSERGVAARQVWAANLSQPVTTRRGRIR